jgi:hypothetical protein
MSRERAQFAAAPSERRYTPWLISTLFPQLPRHSERHFRLALGLGSVVVAVLAAERLFGVALITAALLMPLVTLLYFVDVDVYQDDPLWPMAWSVLWGVVTGIGMGFLAKALAPHGGSLIDRSSTDQILVSGVLIPGLGVVVMLAGPLVLLPYRRFNDALDGATLGSASAATFAAAEAIVVGIGTLTGGLRPPGAAAPWGARLLALAVATPVLAMSAVGFAGAAIWLRYRAPVADRRALGWIGRAPVAVALALILVIAGAASETFLPVGVWLAWLIVLDLGALVLLRGALHVGLLEEAGEREIGPEIRCANCGAQTATHTFCVNCGIALRALPNSRPTVDAAAGSFTGRLAGNSDDRRGMIASGVLVFASAGVALAIVALATPAGPQARCQTGVRCGSPPIAHALAAFPGYTTWESSSLGYSLRYRSEQWSIVSQSPDQVVLGTGSGVSQLTVTGVSVDGESLQSLIDGRVSDLQGQLLGLSAETAADSQILGPNVGLVPGAGAVYRGTIDSPQGPQTPVSVVILAAQQGTLAIIVTVITPANDFSTQATVFGRADDVVDSIEYPGA